MRAIIKRSKAKGKVFAPPSKSMAHRLLVGAALSGERAVISNIAYSKDIEATLNCLKALGAEFITEGDKVTFSGGINPKDGALLYCNESGSTLRFMIPICLLFEKEIELIGSERLFSRPLSVYENICRENGFEYKKEGNKIKLKGKLSPGDYILPGDISSQFITGLMLALSTLEKPSRIILSTELKSEPYVLMTIASLEKFGIKTEKQDNAFVIIPKKRNGGEFSVEGDWSNAAFSDVFNLIGGEVYTDGLDENSLQGDKVYKDYFEKLKNGCPTLPIDNCPELGPVLISAAAMLNGARLTGTNRLKIKESDRGNAMKEELKKLGAEIIIGDDFIEVPKCEFKPSLEPLFGHNDHRIVMSLVPVLSLIGGEIEGAEAVNKSYPDYWEMAKKLGIEVDLI